MTSFAFILGVLPLARAAGPGAEMRQALGTAVFSGMLGVTIFGLFLTPGLLRRPAPLRALARRSPDRAGISHDRTVAVTLCAGTARHAAPSSSAGSDRCRVPVENGSGRWESRSAEAMDSRVFTSTSGKGTGAVVVGHGCF